MLTGVKVKKRDGRIELLDISKIQKYTSAACEGLNNVNQSELELDAKIQFRDGISTEEIQQTLIKTAVDKIDIDRPDWTFVAARLFLYDLYHKVSRWTGYRHLKEYFEQGEKEGRIVLGLKEKYDLDDLNDYIKPERDLQFTYLGIKTLYDRYLLKDKQNNPIELPQHMFMGVAMFLAQNEENRQVWAKKFYDILSKFEVMAATPTLSNARTPRHQLSSCYVGSMNDNIEGIFDDYKEMALLSKFGGGIGWDVSRIRALGSFIDNHKNAAGGVIPWLRITNDIAIAVDQLGTRKGAIAVYLEPWHMDVMDFLELKKNSGEERRRAHDLFPALWINDLFMKRVANDEFWTLFDPYEVPDLTDCYAEEFEKKYLEYEKDENLVKHKVKAKELWKKVLTEYYETGNPFLCFKDNANIRNQNEHSGIIRSSNLCVTGDTRLATQFGLVKAKELEKMNKKIIASYDLRTDGDRKNYGVSTAECIEMYKTKENAKVYKITTKDGYEIKSTDWHEYYVLRDKAIIKIPLKDVKLTDKLLIQSAEGQFGKEGNYELGFLTGLIAGDGTFAKNHSNHQVACIDLYNEDMQMKDDVLEYIKKVTKEEYSTLHKFIKKDDEIKMPKEFKHTKNSKKMRFQSVKLGRILDEKYNFNKKTKLKVPEFVFQGKKECVKGYLQGLFTSDATVNKLKNDKIPTFAIQFATISEELAKDVQILLANFGIRTKITLNKKRDSFKYTTKNGKNKEYKSKLLYRLNINGRNATKFIKEIGFIGEKQVKALNILIQREKLGVSVESNKSEYFETKIEKIEYIGKEDVYDTTQLVNHSLIFNGLVTGNCTEIYQNTKPNHYKIEITYEDESVELFEEEEIVEVDGGFKKPAKKLSSIDSINSKKIYIAQKQKIDGDTAVCNLASVNLSKVNTPEDFKRVIPVAIRMLDNVIDLNFYPQRKVKDTNIKNRAIGLGVMGEAQYLAENQIEWGSEKHFLKIDELMENFSYWAIKTSAELAQEKGIYPEFEGSKWQKGILPIDTANSEAKKLVQRDLFIPSCCDWDSLRKEVKKGMRNGYLMAIAPTSSISILSGTTQAIEPVYKRKWFEENLSGLIPVVVPNLSPDTWQFYTPAYELDQRLLVKAAAIRQKWIDQGQSLNIFIDPKNASGRYLNEIYTLGWKLGIKSFYYLRSKSPEAEQDVMDRSIECMGCQ